MTKYNKSKKSRHRLNKSLKRSARGSLIGSPPMGSPPMGSRRGSRRATLRSSRRGTRRSSPSEYFTRKPKKCVRPRIFLTNNDVLFQVSFNDPDEIVYTNKTKNSMLDCGYKGLAALGLRNKQRALMESSLVNRRGTEGIEFEAIKEYIRDIYDLGIDRVVINRSPANPADVVSYMRSNLKPKHATLYVIGLRNRLDLTDYFFHYMVAFNLRNTIYYYNPQTNLENYPAERYISTNLEELVNNIYPEYYVFRFLYYNITEHGVPKPLNVSKLTTYLEFYG